MQGFSLKRWSRTTFGLVTIVGIVFALTTLAIGIIAFEATHEALEQQLDHRIATETASLIDEGDDGPGGVAAAIRRREAARSTASLDFRLVDSAGRLVAGSLDAVVPDKPGYIELLPYTRDGEQRIAQSLTTLLPSGHRLLVAADRAVIDEMDASLLKLFVGAFGVMLALGVGAAWVVGIVTKNRLSRIDHTAKAIIDGDLGRRMPVTGAGDEFDRVAETLNQMLDRIAALMDNLRQVSSDVAHDLRTPLTRLHNRLDEALATDDRDAQRLAIEAATAQSRELLDIFAALLRIAEVEGIGVKAQFREMPLSELVDSIVETYRPDAEISGHTLNKAIEPNLKLVGDRRLIQQLLSNLLDNALAHTPAGTTITVMLDKPGDHSRIVIADDGPGVAPEETSNLFQRFTRGQRSRTSDGHGLGLALVAAIATAHGGKLTLTSNPGFEIKVEL
jgi:signal transduction histidine kinase